MSVFPCSGPRPLLPVLLLFCLAANIGAFLTHSRSSSLRLSPLRSSTSIGAIVDDFQLVGKTLTVVGAGEEQLLATRFLSELKPNTLLVLGTYAADFNAIEYAQRLRFYLPALKAKGISQAYMVMNASPPACKEFKRLLELPDEVVLLSDSNGAVGKAFGCSRGWRPDDLTSPYAKLFGMLLGFGAIMTLPSVISGYLGNPFSKQPWIEASMGRNQARGMWPDTALVLGPNGEVVTNKFDELPVVGGWGRRPLELATLRLQNMLGISLKNWKELMPTTEELEKGLLTQLGGLVVFGDSPSQVRYKWIDDGICDVCNMEALLEKI